MPGPRQSFGPLAAKEQHQERRRGRPKEVDTGAPTMAVPSKLSDLRGLIGPFQGSRRVRMSCASACKACKGCKWAQDFGKLRASVGPCDHV